MFIYTVHGSTIRFFSIVAAALLVLTGLILLIPESSGITSASAGENQTFRYDGIKTESDRISFLEQFGWEIEKEVSSAKIRIPQDFDKVMASYNELQKSQGFDLARVKGKEVTRYTYRITNFPDYTGTVYANLIVWNNKIVGGDICSADASGFIYPFSGK